MSSLEAPIRHVIPFRCSIPATLNEKSASSNQLHLVGIINGEIVAVTNISASPKERLQHVGELGISVKKIHWGDGIGKGMLNYMLNWAAENQIIKKLMLRVHEDNISAKRLYDTLSFSVEGRLTKDFKLILL